MRRNIYIVMCAMMVALAACSGSIAPTTQPISPTRATPVQSSTSAPSATQSPTSAPEATATVPGQKGGDIAKVSDDMIRNKLAAANTQFGIKLLSEILKQDNGKNVFISPASVAIALAMTYNGASGDTQKAMAQALELQGMTLQEVNEAYAALKASLQNADPKVQLSIANSLWVKQGVQFKPDFLQRTQSYYQAKVTELNFADPNAAGNINAWVSQNTNGKIQQIVDQIPPEMVLYLINAIYFKGTWTKQFDKAKT